MRKLIAAIMVAGATLVAGSALAADFPYYPPVIEIPDVDYGVQGSFYLRGSAAGNYFWSKEGQGYDCNCALVTNAFDTGGYGYSVGAGFGYETGTGLRVNERPTLASFGNIGMVGDLAGSGFFKPALDTAHQVAWCDLLSHLAQQVCAKA